ncbi:MG2 domain-containing protein [Agriterribacter sp.]|uniref:alpha-2-macroglobulin family protein n=1 Tax=Agriterribacter sp. TaxID=2821509 RepID=UPI002BD9EF1A|nr:MG2 domain-containing protein [Agriterribacter sp.]HRP56850.1 MG2 domain-containing protein [Agriterribacter sp.]
MKFLKHLLLYTFSFLLFIQTKSQTKMNYNDAWKKIDNLIQERSLPKSAIAEVNKIYERAKKEKNDAQLIRALIYQVNLNATLTESGAEESIRKIEAEIRTTQPPVRYILQSVAAGMYWQYFQNNRWEFYDRTNTTNVNKEDIATWTLDDLHHKISELYVASVADEKILQQIKPEAYEPIIIKGNTRNLRPTLYDLLAHRALDYFENDERDITRPAYAFIISENTAFAPAADFIHHVFPTKDSSSLHHKALLIFRQLLSFHINDSEPDALMDADLRRLQFVYRHAAMPGKDELYKTALEQLTTQYDKQPAAAQAWGLLAQYYFRQGTNYDEAKGNEDLRYAYKTAREICEKTIKDFPGTEGAALCSNLLNNILGKSLTLQTEKVNIPGEAFRTLVSYKNFFTCHFRIVKIDRALKEQWQNRYETAYWNKLTDLPAVRTWQQELPATDDYRDHSVEVKIDPLPAGEYVLLGSVNNSFTTARNLLAAQYFYVSNISYVNNNNSYFVLHRNTGKPLAGALVQVWTSGYDYTDRKNKLQKAENITTGKNGFFELKTTGRENRNARLEIRWEKDHLFMDDYEYLYTRYDANEANATADEYEQKNARIYFFTDRSIYRPGQTVYFKGIGVTKNAANRQAVAVTGKTVKVYLQDVNSEVLDSLSLTLNEYGSIHGQFQLPQHVLTGNFNIQVQEYNQSSARFSVEEYKRPKFLVEINKPQSSYRVNDTVSITGTARAYAGNNIDGATVKYRVSRRARFRYPWLYYRNGMPHTAPMEIANGLTTTDSAGNFSIRFKAIPDLTISQTLEPVFDYTIEADVTDINGETRSSTEIVQVGYKAIQLDIAMLQSGPLALDNFNAFNISSKNMNGVFEPVQANVKIYPLQSPGRLIRSRYWQKPDQFIYKEDEFIRLFPHDEYKDESDYRNWKKGAAVYSDSLTTAANLKYQILNLKLEQGWYAIEATATDKYGAEVKAVEYVQLYDSKSKALPTPAYTWSTGTPDPIQPTGTASFFTGTSASDVFLIQQTDREIEDDVQPLDAGAQNNAEGAYRFFTMNNEKKDFRFTATEEDRGGFGVLQFFVKNNRLYTNSHVIAVPWTNKQLNISFTTFRDKMEPGSGEKWEVKITGTKGEKVAAEMLAAMYDASLDQFKPHNWSVPGIWPEYYLSSYWNGQQNFEDVQSQQRNDLGNATGKKNEVFIKNYDRLIDVGTSWMNDVVVVGYGLQKRSMGVAAAPAAPPSAMAMEEKAADASGISDTARAKNEEEDLEVTTGNNSSTRKNFNETAFFFPDLKTDSSGNISFSFTMPEALTQWKLMTFAHTPALALGYAQQLAVTQKELMVQPNAPRFLREKDRMAFSAKIVNMGDSLINGFAKLELFDAGTNEPVDVPFHNAVPAKNFSILPGQSEAVLFQLTIPENFNTPLLYRISATSSPRLNGSILSDGEENVLPVLSNRMLVTETLPLNMRGSGTQQFKFEKLLKSDTTQASSQKNYALTVEYTANPAWYAVQALPYLTAYPYECSEQTFNRYYANTLATLIANSAPRIKAVYDKWRTDSTSSRSLVSGLEKNEELKSILLQETPWVLQARNEAEQKQNIALLFDMMRMSSEAKTNFNKLKDMQTSNGGFVWFKGGSDDRYITQYIVTGAGHLLKLNALPENSYNEWNEIIDAALRYADARIKEDYDNLVKQKTDLKKNNLTGIAVQYLYMRSFFKEKKVNETALKAYQYYKQQAKQFWAKESKYFQGMIALSLHRDNDRLTPKAILASLKENAITHEELGMYWKDNRRGYYWHEAPVEIQSLLIGAFNEITHDTKAVNDMKLWLLKQKQTQHWGTTKSTAEACYALLLPGADWLSNPPQVNIQLGAKEFSSSQTDEAGTGYFKYKVAAEEIKPAMGNIQVTISPSSNSSGSWGAVYWQYFEDLDKISASAENKMPMQLKKQLFIEKNSDQGPVLQPVDSSTVLKVGDKIKVRIELRADRDMEYVHMKDLRAAGTEPVNVLSRYKWQGGLGYYESTKDASTNFFFSWLRKGTYVFEYPLFVTHRGDFSAGVATIQCMYAPEFLSHSEGTRITVK